MLTPLPVAAKPVPWCRKALMDIGTDGYDHPDIEEWREAIAELAALEDRIRDLARRASYPKPLREIADGIQDHVGSITDAAWRWNDDRAGREIGDRAAAQRLAAE